ncbi:histidine kinase [Echinicola sp. CAU 1574]|uniref:Histidine kinase n=1 Tax=Echinicola arenosa TaxID=2774144 RepID=A0ABR9ATF1_9BACT|nr:histidine kinase [Echinicola arenosa]MBD8491165.1 histidine kinase [Echinicola arenosa]
MITRLLKTSDQGWLKILIFVFLVIVGIAYLITYYGWDLKTSFLDSIVFTGLAFGGVMLLENIFRFYQPQKSNTWLLIGLPLLLDVFVVFAASMLLKYFIKIDLAYLDFLNDSLVIRAVIVLIVLGMYTAILVVGGQLEDQLEVRKRSEAMERLSKEAELYHLRQQLQPHFLFNSLNSVNALVKREPEQAREMILQLSEFLRGTIRKNDMEWVTVEEETNYLKLFLKIEKVRFGHRLEVEFEVEEEACPLMVPPLLIQPLLENAVKHGVYGQLDGVMIQVHVAKVKGYLEVEISNPYDPNAVNEKGEGFGLESVKRRVYLLFGRNDLLSVSKYDDLFRVSLRIPVTYDQNHNN